MFFDRKAFVYLRRNSNMNNMKTKIILSLALLSTAAYAQEPTTTTTTTSTVIVVTDTYPDYSFNRWSIDAQFGLNYAQGPMTAGYSTNEYGL